MIEADSNYVCKMKKLKPEKFIYHVIDKEDEPSNFCKFKKMKPNKNVRNMNNLMINNKLYQKIAQTFVHKFKKDILEFDISKVIFKNPKIDMAEIIINETTADGKKILNITAITDIEEIVNVEGEKCYCNMTVPFSITKISLENSTDCPPFE